MYCRGRLAGTGALTELIVAGLARRQRPGEEVPVQFPLRAIQDIGRYALFIEGALPGVALPIGAEALSAAAATAFADLHLEFVPRLGSR